MLPSQFVGLEIDGCDVVHRAQRCSGCRAEMETAGDPPHTSLDAGDDSCPDQPVSRRKLNGTRRLGWDADAADVKSQSKGPSSMEGPHSLDILILPTVSL
jgi:hypothetical protein